MMLKINNLRCILYIFLFFSLNSSVYSKEFLLTCLNPQNNNFQTTYKIKDDLLSRILGKSVFHVSSYDPLRDKKFVVNKYEKIINFKNKKITTTISSNNGKIINFTIYDLENKNYTQSGHYLNDSVKPFSQYFSCF